MGVTPDQMRRAMRKWATGVTIVSVQYENQRHGMTVSSFVSVSLEPPLVIISLEQSSRTCQLVERARIFGLTMLASDQKHISERFAGGIPDGADRFHGLRTFTLSTGAPLVVGGLSYLDCVVEEGYEYGSQRIFVGRVDAVKLSRRSDPLLYFNRKYHQIAEGEGA